MTKRNKKAFTIVELVIVIAVIAILAAVLIPTFSGIVDKAQKSAAMQEVASAYKEAFAVALSDGVIEEGEEGTASGFIFVFSNNGSNATVTAPQNFKFSEVSIQNGKVVLDGMVVNPDGTTAPPVQSDVTTSEDTTESNEPETLPVISVSSVALDKTSLTLTVGGTDTLTAIVSPDNATDKTVTWSSSAEGIATVSGGVVTAVAPGSATITAIAGDKSATCTVTVNPIVYTVSKNVTNVTVTGADSVNKGATYSATVSASAGYNIVVKMGGQAVANAYSETSVTSGTITVTNVTADIEIVAVAAANFADPSDANWMKDTRISGSGKSETSAPGWTVTNYFELQNGDIVYAANLYLNTEATYCSAYYKGTNGKPDCLATFVLPYGQTQGWLKDLVFGDVWTQFTVTYSGVSYMRIFGQVTLTDSDVIIMIKRNGEWLVPAGSEIPPEEGGEENTAPKVLYAIGDSITNGTGDSGSDRWTLKGGWLEYVVTAENGFDTVNSKNLGISGLGFVHTDHNYNLTARDVIENSDALQAAGGGNTNKVDVSAKFGDYDLSKADVITVALGVNDWKDISVTVSDYLAEMEYCLRKIRELNPTCEIYYILPFNTSTVGTYDTNFSFGAKGDSNAARCYGNTLQQFKDMIRAELEGDLAELNIEIIEIDGLDKDDLQKYKNGDADKITDDGLHPNVAGYEKVGNDLAEEIKKLMAD